MIRRILSYIGRIKMTRQFQEFGEGSFINQPQQVNGPQNIRVGSGVSIGYKSWLAAMPHTGVKDCLLEFGDNCSIGNFNHIYATSKIVFGKSVLTADRVYVSDNVHEYGNIHIPIKDQGVRQLKDVYIGDGSWLGENVCVIGASIGKNCVIGANAVVTKDIPDYSVAVGIPAKIIKRFNQDSGRWQHTTEDGNFI